MSEGEASVSNETEVPSVAEAATDVEATESVAGVHNDHTPTARAAGVVDDLFFLLPFVFDPTAITAFTDGVRWMVEEATWEGKWQGFKKIGDVAFPLADKWAARSRVQVAEVPDAGVRDEVAAAIEVRALTNFAACEARLEAQRLGDGQLIGRLREAFGKLNEFQKTPLGQLLVGTFLELFKDKLTGSLSLAA